MAHQQNPADVIEPEVSFHLPRSQDSQLTKEQADDHIEDSGLDSDSESMTESTTSITSSIMKYRQENGRTYHDLQHHVYLLTFEHKLVMCPLPKKLDRVLDIGTGTGIWAIDFADEHPESMVLGIDLSPIQPPLSVPPNLSFEIDDIEETWTYSYKFDFIHSRMMVGSIGNWPKLFERAYENLNPGGRIQLSDAILPNQSDDGTLGPATAKWGQLMVEGVEMIGRSMQSAKLYKEQLIAAGFEDVEEIIFKWPMNKWPKDPKLKEIGMWTLEHSASAIPTLSLAVFTRVLGWTLEELNIFLIDVMKETKNTSHHTYWAIYVVYGKKPE
ncbi:hypothetical protein BUE80_DR004213 [Diplocarpon rosae]|nr:hypothetical protein BUE80_DR004213 [Diplocarpon rosae]